MRTTDIDLTETEPDTLDGEFDDWPDVFSEDDFKKKGGTKNADSDSDRRGDGE